MEAILNNIKDWYEYALLSVPLPNVDLHGIGVGVTIPVPKFVDIASSSEEWSTADIVLLLMELPKVHMDMTKYPDTIYMCPICGKPSIRDPLYSPRHYHNGAIIPYRSSHDAFKDYICNSIRKDSPPFLGRDGNSWLRNTRILTRSRTDMNATIPPKIGGDKDGKHRETE